MEPNQQTQKLAAFYALIAASQSPGHLGYAVGISTIKEARTMIVQTVPERRGRIAKTSETSVMALFPDATEALKAAIAIQRSAVENRGKKAPLNIRIFIGFSDGTTDEGQLLAELSALAAKATEIAKPGHIYVSTEAYSNAPGLNAVEFKPFGVAENLRAGQSPYYDVVWHPETDCSPGGMVSAESIKTAAGRAGAFMHGAALVTGPNAPCFYCGSGKHKSSACPSKQLHYATNGLERIGHLSMDEINRLFSDYLTQAGDDLSIIPEPASKDDGSLTYLAPWAFYELKRGFQLRFLGIIWNALAKEDWYKARESNREGSPEGGMLWLARDCIRTGRLEEAEDLFKRYGRKNPTDYRTLCGQAFVKIEKENYLTAADYLIEALNQPTTNLQKTYVLLLLSRVYGFASDESKAEERLKDALGIEPYCPEATFELALRYFKGRRETDAVNRLVKLVHVCKEYYSAILIAPELAKYQELFVPEFEKILEKARAEARLVTQEAERAVNVLKGFVGEHDEDSAQTLVDYQQMADLLEKPEALFNYEDISHTGRRLAANCRDVERERADQAMKTIRKLENRASEIFQRSTQPRKVEALLKPISERLMRLKEDVQVRAPIEPCLSECEESGRELDVIEATVKKMDASHASFMIWAKFSKDMVIVLFITGAVGLVLFPGAVSLLNALFPDFSVLQTGEMWGAEKAILLSGGIFSLLFGGLHIFMERHNLQKDR